MSDTLKTEVTTDPLGRGYSGMSDSEVADDMNTVYRTKTRETVSGWEIFNITDDVEYAALSDVEKTSWDNLCAIEQIDTSSGIAKVKEAALFGVGTTTRQNLIDLKNPPASRAEELGLLFVYPGHVEEVRRNG
jgi:hypothetical protein